MHIHTLQISFHDCEKTRRFLTTYAGQVDLTKSAKRIGIVAEEVPVPLELTHAMQRVTRETIRSRFYQTGNRLVLIFSIGCRDQADANRLMRDVFAPVKTLLGRCDSNRPLVHIAKKFCYDDTGVERTNLLVVRGEAV